MAERSAEQLDRYLLDGERIVVAVHRHWAAIAEPVATSVLLLVVVVWFSIDVDPRFGTVVDALWWVWFAAVARALFVLYEWRREWFVATDRRLLLIYGFIIRKVDMMPLGKVTDMTYHRTVPGRLLGFGTFVLESAGQDQALSHVDFVPRPDRTYRAMIAQIFHREGDATEEPEAEAFEAEVRDEDDPTRRRALSRHLARLVPVGVGRNDLPPDEEEAEEEGAPPPERRSSPASDDPPTESLWENRGESLYRSAQSHDGPIHEDRDDTTGWWNR